MALTPYKCSRSRSSSTSSPIRNRILYQEIYSVGPNTLVRSYSCDQVFDKDAGGRTFQATQIRVSSFITPESQPKNPRMLSLKYPVEKSKMTKRKAKTFAKSSVLRIALKRTMILSLLTATTACAIYFYLNYKECGYVWDLEKTEADLKQHIFGQNQAIEKINMVLKICNRTIDEHVMVFTGGVGIGKTFSSSIISRNFPWSSMKLITYSEYFSSDVENLLNRKLATCGCNLIIVDDLYVKAAGEAINLITLLNNKRQKDENLLVILIFQTHTEKEQSKILNEFKSTYFNIYHVPFKTLTKDVIERCYETEIERQKVKISKEEFGKLVTEKIKPIDIVKGPSGCKGVAEEVASFYKKAAD